LVGEKEEEGKKMNPNIFMLERAALEIVNDRLAEAERRRLVIKAREATEDSSASRRPRVEKAQASASPRAARILQLLGR
jgi:hypothetical protein